VLALVRSVETASGAVRTEQNLKTLEEVLPMFARLFAFADQQFQANAGTESSAQAGPTCWLVRAPRRLTRYRNDRGAATVIRDLLGLSLDDNRYMWLVAVPAKTPPFDH